MKENMHLDILVQGGVITLEARKLTEMFIDKLEEQVTMNWEEETSSMFVTHLAAAMQRMLRQEAITTVADVMRAEMNVEHPSYIMTTKVMNAVQEIAEDKLQLSEEENLLIAMYVTMLIQ